MIRSLTAHVMSATRGRRILPTPECNEDGTYRQKPDEQGSSVPLSDAIANLAGINEWIRVEPRCGSANQRIREVREVRERIDRPQQCVAPWRRATGAACRRPYRTIIAELTLPPSEPRSL